MWIVLIDRLAIGGECGDWRYLSLIMNHRCALFPNILHHVLSFVFFNSIYHFIDNAFNMINYFSIMIIIITKCNIISISFSSNNILDYYILAEYVRLFVDRLLIFYLATVSSSCSSCAAMYETDSLSSSLRPTLIPGSNRSSIKLKKHN